MMVECINCFWVGDEEDLKVFGIVQHCPECREEGCLVDYRSEWESDDDE